MTNPYSIIYPVFAMALLVLVVMLRLAWVRLVAVRQKKMSPEFFKLYQGEETPAERQASRNYSNLFEAPVLFYAGIILIFVTGHVDQTMVALAWLYVAARYAHSAIHLTFNHVGYRFLAFAASQLCLLILWGRLIYGVLVFQSS